jgi:hypothetical protein
MKSYLTKMEERKEMVQMETKAMNKEEEKKMVEKIQ